MLDQKYVDVRHCLRPKNFIEFSLDTSVTKSTLDSFGRLSIIPFLLHIERGGAQWLSGRVLDSRPRGRGLEPHRRHLVVVLEQDTFILA